MPGEVFFIQLESIDGLDVTTHRREINKQEYEALIKDFVYQGEDE